MKTKFTLGCLGSWICKVGTGCVAAQVLWFEPGGAVSPKASFVCNDHADSLHKIEELIQRRTRACNISDDKREACLLVVLLRLFCALVGRWLGCSVMYAQHIDHLAVHAFLS